VAGVERVGVAGAGSMGAGIAQLACMAGYETSLHDPAPDALEAGMERLRAALAKGAERGRWSEEEATAAASRLHPAAELEDLGGCDLVIEAAPESLELKRDLFTALAGICGPEAILATNTSSLSVTAIAAGIEHPDRVVGMHFFNPPPLMRLVEVIAGEESGEEALEATAEAAGRMGRTPIRAADAIGFVANRCARPYSLEGLRLLGERVADEATIDRVCRLGGGFRMGPFELTDLVGIDVNFEVAKSFWEQSFHEPRWQPHPIQARMVAAGRLGRKTGRGYYDYSSGPHREDDPESPPAQRDLAEADEGEEVEGEGFRALRLERGSLAALVPGENAVGFVALPDLGEARLVELARQDETSDATATAAEAHFAALGKHVAWVGDAPGLVLGRIVCQLVNEAFFTLGAGIASAEDIDTAMRLGFNYPRGPFEWCEAIGPERVLAVLDALHCERGEERYRAAPGLRREI
jgi:3-hydroxybutyryl-CoA dehydrogenase